MWNIILLCIFECNKYYRKFSMKRCLQLYFSRLKMYLNQRNGEKNLPGKYRGDNGSSIHFYLLSEEILSRIILANRPE